MGFIISISLNKSLNKRHEAIKKTCNLIYGYNGGYKYRDCVRNPSKDIRELKEMFMGEKFLWKAY